MLPFFTFNPKNYLSGGAVIGCLMIIDALMFFSGNQSFINQTFSMIELAWLVYSMIESYRFRKNGIKLTAPLSYILYYLFGWFFGSYWLAINENLHALPTWYMVLAMLFGTYYTVICLIIYKTSCNK